MDTHFFSQAPAIILEFLKESPDESFKVAEITEARVYPAKYFEVNDWSCETSSE